MTATAYAQAVAALDSVAWRGIMPGLERTRALLAALGNPHAGLRGALVAGTNGKGSVCATVDSVCRAAGYRSVLLTSPHLVSYTERIVRNGVPISEVEFGALVSRVWEAAEPLPEELQPTGFEVLTAAGILAAREADAEVLVCEVGLGGRLDSTNVLDLGVAAVTNVALDHQDLLGETIPEIAREKAAIIKPGNRAVTGASEPGLSEVRARAAQVGAVLTVVGADVPFTGRSAGMGGVAVDSSLQRPPDLGARSAAGCVSGRQHRHRGGGLRRAACDRLRPGRGRGRPRLRERALAGTHGLDRRRAATAYRWRPQPRGHGCHGHLGSGADRPPSLRGDLRRDAQQGRRIHGCRAQPAHARDPGHRSGS